VLGPVLFWPVLVVVLERKTSTHPQRLRTAWDMAFSCQRCFSAVSHLNVRVLLAANGHLLCQKSSTYDSRPPVSSLHLLIGCCAYPKLEV